MLIKVHVYGSRASGLALPDSDLDIAVTIPPPTAASRVSSGTAKAKGQGQAGRGRMNPSECVQVRAHWHTGTLAHWHTHVLDCSSCRMTEYLLQLLGEGLKCEDWITDVETITSAAGDAQTRPKQAY